MSNSYIRSRTYARIGLMASDLAVRVLSGEGYHIVLVHHQKTFDVLIELLLEALELGHQSYSPYAIGGTIVISETRKIIVWKIDPLSSHPIIHNAKALQFKTGVFLDMGDQEGRNINYTLSRLRCLDGVTPEAWYIFNNPKYDP